MSIKKTRQKFFQYTVITIIMLTVGICSVFFILFRKEEREKNEYLRNLIVKENTLVLEIIVNDCINEINRQRLTAEQAAYETTRSVVAEAVFTYIKDNTLFDNCKLAVFTENGVVVAHSETTELSDTPHGNVYSQPYQDYSWIVISWISENDLNQLIDTHIDAFRKEWGDIRAGIVISAILCILAITVVFFAWHNYYTLADKEFKEVDSLANLDSLTECLNRRGIDLHLEKTFQSFREKKHPVCVIMGDIDDFKYINDANGHEYGDTVLRSLAQIMKSMLRENDVIGRWGGEEFLIVIEGQSLDKGTEITERIRASIENQSDRVTMSFGVSVFMYDDMHFKEAVKRADKALYISKSSGKNRLTAYSHEDAIVQSLSQADGI